MGNRDLSPEHGWSRLSDGDLKSYWKSDPYLTKVTALSGYFNGRGVGADANTVYVDIQ